MTVTSSSLNKIKYLTIRLAEKVGVVCGQGVTKRCRLSWLTNSALVSRIWAQMRGLSNEYSCAHGAQINFGDLTPYLTYGLVTPPSPPTYFTSDSLVFFDLWLFYPRLFPPWLSCKNAAQPDTEFYQLLGRKSQLLEMSGWSLTQPHRWTKLAFHRLW